MTSLFHGFLPASIRSAKTPKMYELEGAQFEKGVFEIRAARKRSGALGALMWLGPIRGRFVVLAILLIAAFATIQRQPGNLFVTNGWVHSPEQAALVQNLFSWGLCGVAVLLWLVFLLMREASLTLVFDKNRSEIRCTEEPVIRQRLEKRGLFPFKDLLELRVTGKNAQAPHGYLTLTVRNSEGQRESFSFRFLTDEQAKYFPLNIYRLTTVEPVGDWSDPDAENAKA